MYAGRPEAVYYSSSRAQKSQLHVHRHKSSSLINQGFSIISSGLTRWLCRMQLRLRSGWLQRRWLWRCILRVRCCRLCGHVSGGLCRWVLTGWEKLHHWEQGGKQGVTHGVLVVSNVHCLSLDPANGWEGGVGIHGPQWLCPNHYGDVEVKVVIVGGDNHFNVQHVVSVDNPAGM